MVVLLVVLLVVVLLVLVLVVLVFSIKETTPYRLYRIIVLTIRRIDIFVKYVYSINQTEGALVNSCFE